jgi:hypothetical protein
LIAETQDYRSKAFTQLTGYEQKKIMLLNRLLLETIYLQAPQRKYWLVGEKPRPAPVSTKVCEYLYVWEFSDGKLLLVKEKQGSYSAEIHIPVAKEWLDLKGISEKELKELIKQPVKLKKVKK